MWKKYKKRIFQIVLIGLLVAGGLTIYANYTVRSHSAGKTFLSVSDIPFNKVGMVLGTAKYVKNGTVNLYFEYRIRATVKLYNAGKIKFVLVSGDNGSKSYDEPTTFKNELIARGIPANKIFLDYAGFRTLDSVVRADKIFGQKKFTVISQKFHNDRAIYIASKKDLDVVGFNASDVVSSGGLKTKIREVFARAKAFLDIVLGVKPKFLGESIHIV